MLIRIPVKKLIIRTALFLVLCNLLLPYAPYWSIPKVAAASPLPSEAKNDSVDPDIEMVSGEDYRNHELNRPNAKGTVYTIKHPTDTNIYMTDYMNDMNWYVEVQGYNFKQKMANKRIGKMMTLLRPISDGSMGRMTALPKDAEFWAQHFNGNKEFVARKSITAPMKVINNNTRKTYNRLYIRDLARWSGATINIVGTGKYDSGSGNELSIAKVTTTSYPNAEVGVPTKIKAGDAIDISYKGEEFYPQASYGVRPIIKYKLMVNDEVVAEDYELAKKFDLKKSYTFKEDGKYKISLEVKDQAERSYIATQTVTVGDTSGGGGGTVPPVGDNKPPVAEVNVRPFYYWTDTVDIATLAYDPDGEIANEELFVDGESSGKEWKSSRVTETTPHTVYYRVTDNLGASADASAEFEIWATTPKAAVDIDGTLKENRAVTLDAKASDRISPVEKAPIDYGRTTWKITPVSDGLAESDIKIRAGSDPSKRQVLFKKAGTYQLEVTVTNVYDEVSEVYTKELEVQEDLNPIARFTVDKSVYLRDKDDSKNAVVTLTDSSVSIDADRITKRIWYVEFDANNDGIFGTAADGGKQIISSDNATKVQYKTKHVGHYRFSLEVVEAYGQSTLEEFIEDGDYRRDLSNVVDKDGSVEVYMEPENFNIPEFDTAVEVNNVPPIIDFGVKRKNDIQVVLDFGGMDTATRQHKTGSRPGGGSGNGGGGGYYNHYYYTFDTLAKNQLSAYAGSLESDLRMKGLNATVVTNNSYYYQADYDGECIESIPVWGWVDRGSYTYSSYSGDSPYSGDWEVTSSSSEPIYGVVWCYEVYYDQGKPVEHSHEPPCSKPQNEITGQVGTRYTASLRKWIPDYRFEITNYTSEGCSYEEKVDTTDFTDAFRNTTYKNTNYKYYYRMDKSAWSWANNSTKRNYVINKAKSDGIYFWSNANELLRSDAQKLVNDIGKGTFTKYSEEYLQSNIEKLREELLNRFMIEEDAENFTIVLGDELDYTTVYDDYENDPELQREWKFVHDPSEVKGRPVDDPFPKIAQSGLYIDKPMQLNAVGTYTVTLRAKDNPLSDVGNDSRFTDYQKWSDEELVREYKIHVHRRPIADFTSTVEAGTLKLTLDPSSSYDPDHKKNWKELGIAERGIVEYTWEKYVVDGVEYQGKPPSVLQAGKDYFVTLRVKDIDGAYGTVTKLITTKNVNLKPIAKFDAPSVVLTTTKLNDPTTSNFILDRSYDPNGDPLVNYNWTIKRQSDGATVYSGSTYPESFASAGLGAGKYRIGLTVWDDPKYPPALQSDLYEREITVTVNNPPNSCFELSQTAISKGSIQCIDGMESPYELVDNKASIYTDNSSDPDGHALVNYSWKVEKLDKDNKVLNTWNVGSAPVDFSVFGGVGRYRVTQTVFDLPPTPLPSLSGSISKIYKVVKGQEKPYAQFEYSPLEPISGDTIDLKDTSWDEDGTIVRWSWTIEAPNGTRTTQTVQNPKITNAMVGTYKVTLNVWDNSGLQSKNPAYKEIVVKAPPPNKPPVAIFTWEPFEPILGTTFKLNPDASYDLDGTITSYQWSIRSKEGSVTNNSTKYPVITANSEYYDVTLTVRDDKGATNNVTQRIKVNIARIDPFVTHTAEWKNYWVSQGESPDVNKFLAGEKFIIEIKTTPANKVEGVIDFGRPVGKVEIPSSAIKLVNKGTYEYTWRAELWRKDFEKIRPGGYMFEFTGYYPDTNPTITAKGMYLIEIVDDIYSSFNFHRNY